MNCYKFRCYREDYCGIEGAIAIYKGSVKKFLETIAFELDIPTTETKYNNQGEPTGERALTVEQLKEEIACGSFPVGASRN